MFKISVALAILLFFQAVTSSPIEKRQGDQKLQVDKFDNTNLLDNASDSPFNQEDTLLKRQPDTLAFSELDKILKRQAGKLKVDAIESPDLLDDTPDCPLAADDTTLLKRQAAGKLKVDAVENPDLEDTTPGCSLDQGPVTDSSDEPSVATGISRPTSGIAFNRLDTLLK